MSWVRARRAPEIFQDTSRKAVARGYPDAPQRRPVRREVTVTSAAEAALVGLFLLAGPAQAQMNAIGSVETLWALDASKAA